MCIRDRLKADLAALDRKILLSLKSVDAFVIAQLIESLVYIRYGVQYNVVLPVQSFTSVYFTALLIKLDKIIFKAVFPI